MEIRKAKIADLPAINELALGQLDFHSRYSNYYRPLGPETRRKHGREYFGKIIRARNSLFLVAEGEGKVIAYAIGKIIRNPPVLEIKRSGEVAEIFIDEEYRGKGVGPKLVDEILAWFREKKIRHVFVIFDHRNRMAKRVYQKKGFMPFQEKWERYLK
jgi:ribosomal protein S18 acetylase RimI-like enzyme